MPNQMLPKILTEEELNHLSNAANSLNGLRITNVMKLINSHRSLLSANAELSFKNMKLKELLNKLDSYMDFSVPWIRKQELSFTDPSGINEVFKEVYRIINPEQAAINEALEESK